MAQASSTQEHIPKSNILEQIELTREMAQTKARLAALLVYACALEKVAKTPANLSLYFLCLQSLVVKWPSHRIGGPNKGRMT